MAGIEPWQLTVWEAEYRLEPWGDDWVQAARIEAAIINTNSMEKVDYLERIPNEDNRRTEEIDEANLMANWKARLGF